MAVKEKRVVALIAPSFSYANGRVGIYSNDSRTNRRSFVRFALAEALVPPLGTSTTQRLSVRKA